MNKLVFVDWVLRAKPGDRIEYFSGHISTARHNSQEQVLAITARMACHLGLLFLTQKANEEMVKVEVKEKKGMKTLFSRKTYSYIAERSSVDATNKMMEKLRGEITEDEEDAERFKASLKDHAFV